MISSETTIVVPWFSLLVPSDNSGLLANNFYTPSKFISPCLMPQIANRGGAGGITLLKKIGSRILKESSDLVQLKKVKNELL